MPQYPFVQVMAVAGLLAIAAAAAAMPLGATVDPRAGRTLLRASLYGVLLIFAGCFAWGGASGDLASFNALEGWSAWLQMGAFFGIVYMTGYRFVDAYLRDKGKGASDA